MSLDQVKDIIRKTLGTEAHRSGDGADANQSWANQTSWAAVKVPVNVTIRSSSGAAGVFKAQTVFASRRGVKLVSSEIARAVSSHPLKPHQTLWIEVPSTGKATGGEVIWTGSGPNSDGNIEFAIEVDSPNLFEVLAPDVVHQQKSGAQDAGKIAATTEIAARSESASLSAAQPETVESASPSCEPAPASPLPQTVTPAETPLPMTERLAQAFTEVFETALQQQQRAASARIQSEIKEGVAKAQAEALEIMRKDLAQHVIDLEQELLQQSRARTEQALAVITKTALQSLSAELDDLTVKTEQRIQEMFKTLADQLDQRSAAAVNETTRRLDEQIERSTTAIQSVLVRKVLTEVSQKQKDMTEQVEKQIGRAAELNLVRLRGGLMRALQELTNENGGGQQ
jgi:hypothetical protein